jgi:hypothetical protein
MTSQSNSREMLFDGRRREPSLHFLDKRRDVDRLHRGELIEAALFAPRDEAALR